MIFSRSRARCVNVHVIRFISVSYQGAFPLFSLSSLHRCREAEEQISLSFSSSDATLFQRSARSTGETAAQRFAASDLSGIERHISIAEEKYPNGRTHCLYIHVFNHRCLCLRCVGRRSLPRAVSLSRSTELKRLDGGNSLENRNSKEISPNSNSNTICPTTVFANYPI